MTEVVYALLYGLRPESADAMTKVMPFVDVGRSLTRASKEAGIKHVHLHRLRHNADFQIMPTQPSLCPFCPVGMDAGFQRRGNFVGDLVRFHGVIQAVLVNQADL